MHVPPRPRPLRLVPGLAASHLRHEWILTLCLVIALAAVIAPLLVLLGLKHGTIQTLRERLVEDPVFRELRPAQTREYPPEWFARVAEWPGVAFLTPTVLPLSSVLQVPYASRSGAEVVDLVPTAPGDPLLLENGARVPSGDTVVLTAEAARRLGVTAGDRLQGRTTRSRGGRTEAVETPLLVAEVLPPRAGSLARIYAPLSFVLDVEAFKEGYGAPARGWPGESPTPYLSFDGAVLLLAEPMLPVERTGLVINTGFAQVAELDAGGVHERLRWTPSGDWAAYDLVSPSSAVMTSSLNAIGQKLRGRDAILLPYVRGITLSLGSDESVQPVGVSLEPAVADRLALPPLPWGRLNHRTEDARPLNQALLAAGAPDRVEVSVDGAQPLRFPLEKVGVSPLGQPILPAEMLGVLRTAQQRGVEFDVQSGQFLMQRGGYRGFRLYAASIDDVPGLYRRFLEEGVEVLAEVETIERIQVLDAGLGRLFWMIAILGVSGGVAVLVASLYAAVERRRRDLGVLRLVGLARRHVFFFPVAQGIIIAGLGLVAGLASYAGLALAINRAFSSDLAPGEKFCTLPASYVAVAFAVTLVLATLSSLAAAWHATHIDPAEAIREQ